MKLHSAARAQVHSAWKLHSAARAMSIRHDQPLSIRHSRSMSRRIPPPDHTIAEPPSHHISTGPTPIPYHQTNHDRINSTATPTLPPNQGFSNPLHTPPSPVQALPNEASPNQKCQAKLLQPGPTSSYILPRPLPPTSFYK
jgi:hypothetical protein